jgi:hypothetical protein
MVASIIKTTKLDAIPSIDYLGASGGLSFFRWGYAENAIIIITSSIPCLRSLAINSVRKMRNTYPGRSYALTDWPFSRTHQSRTHSQTNNLAASHWWRRPDNSPHGQATDSIERIFALEAHQETNVRPHSEESETGPAAQLDISRGALGAGWVQPAGLEINPRGFAGSR